MQCAKRDFPTLFLRPMFDTEIIGSSFKNNSYIHIPLKYRILHAFKEKLIKSGGVLNLMSGSVYIDLKKNQKSEMIFSASLASVASVHTSLCVCVWGGIFYYFSST